MKKSEIIVDHIIRDNIVLSNEVDTDIGIVTKNHIKTHPSKVYYLIEGMIGLFGIPLLRKEIDLIHAYLQQLKNFGADHTSMTISPITIDDRVHIKVVITMHTIQTGDLTCGRVFDLKSPSITEQIHAWICSTCTDFMDHLTEENDVIDELGGSSYKGIPTNSQSR
jgi:hypothetical protein